MSYPTKITTCCYCGARAALVLDQARHELACASCGAPLHNLKRLPKEPRVDPVRNTLASKPKPKSKKGKAKKKKPSKWRLKDVFEEAFDLVEDIFD